MICTRYRKGVNIINGLLWVQPNVTSTFVTKILLLYYYAASLYPLQWAGGGEGVTCTKDNILVLNDESR